MFLILWCSCSPGWAAHLCTPGIPLRLAFCLLLRPEVWEGQCGGSDGVDQTESVVSGPFAVGKRTFSLEADWLCDQPIRSLRWMRQGTDFAE